MMRPTWLSLIATAVLASYAYERAQMQKGSKFPLHSAAFQLKMFCRQFSIREILSLIAIRGLVALWVPAVRRRQAARDVAYAINQHLSSAERS